VKLQHSLELVDSSFGPNRSFRLGSQPLDLFPKSFVLFTQSTGIEAGLVIEATTWSIGLTAEKVIRCNGLTTDGGRKSRNIETAISVIAVRLGKAW
jgi:hypothetical protein